MVTNDECDLSNVIMIIEALHIKTPICARIPISKDRLAVFTNYPSVTKDQTLEETVFMGFFHPVHSSWLLSVHQHYY